MRYSPMLAVLADITNGKTGSVSDSVSIYSDSYKDTVLEVFYTRCYLTPIFSPLSPDDLRLWGDIWLQAGRHSDAGPTWERI